MEGSSDSEPDGLLAEESASPPSEVVPSSAPGSDAQVEPARRAAEARQVIAKKIAALVPKVEGDTEAQVVLHLAEAYAYLAAEPPRARPG